MSAQQRALVCQPANLLDTQRPGHRPPAAPAAQVFIDPITGLPYNRGFLQILRRNVEGGGRRDDLQHTSYRIVAGMNGQLERRLVVRHVLSVRADQLRRDLFERLLGPPPRPRARRHRQSGHGRRRSDLPFGAAGGMRDPTCVPWDIFALGQVTPAALTYLQTPGLQRGVTQQSIANASLTGDLGAGG